MGPHGFTITRTALLATLLFSLMYLGQSLEPVACLGSGKKDVYSGSACLCEKGGVTAPSGEPPWENYSKCRTLNALDICSDAPAVADATTKKHKCGFMTQAEYFQLYSGATLWRGHQKYQFKNQWLHSENRVDTPLGNLVDPQRPLWIATGDTWGLWHSPLSLTRQGKVLLRSVFQMHKQPKPKSTCAGVRLTPAEPIPLPAGPTDAAAVQVVRCLLELPAGSGTEAGRATRGKEVKCWHCGDCGASGNGCPSVQGAWYTDTYTMVARGCGFDRSKGFEYQIAGMRVEPGNEAQVVKFEVCNDPGCFDQAHEAKKLAAAKSCTAKACDF